MLINSKNLNKWTFYEFLFHKIIYASALKINLLSIFMLTKMRLHMIVNKADKFCEIQSSENHNLIIINLIFINNFYFLDIVKNLTIMKNLLIWVNAADKKSNHKQWKNVMRFIKIWHCHLNHFNIDDIKNIQQVTLKVKFHKLTKKTEQKSKQKSKSVCQFCIQKKQMKK